MRYMRSRVKGGTYFFTLVTHNRKKILCADTNVQLLREAFQYVMDQHPFTIDAHVILPEHLHCIWTLPEDDHDFSTRWRMIKGYFTRNMNTRNGMSGCASPNPTYGKAKPASKTICRSARGTKADSNTQKQPIWQKRFWEHTIRDEIDMKNHVEYIHFNPVKHGLVQAPVDWSLSSIHRYVLDGLYQPDWGVTEDMKFAGSVGME